jgi:hypothetical protein
MVIVDVLLPNSWKIHASVIFLQYPRTRFAAVTYPSNREGIRAVSGGFGLSLFLFDYLYGNPGYNRDRGPVLVPDIRFHLDF